MTRETDIAPSCLSPLWTNDSVVRGLTNSHVFTVRMFSEAGDEIVELQATRGELRAIQPAPTEREGSMGEAKFNATNIHELKIHPAYYHRICDGSKRFEVRRDDRGFQRGDLLHLREVNPGKPEALPGYYTGNDCFVLVLWILTGGQFGVEAGHVVMSIELIDEDHELSPLVDAYSNLPSEWGGDGPV